MTTTVLGMGAMGRALAGGLREAGHDVTAWNRTPGRVSFQVSTVAAAVGDASLVVACLLGHASVHETLDPVAGELRGRTLVNVTTTTPAEARELAAWADKHGIDYLDGAILAVPEMIGTPAAQIFYSGSAGAFTRHRDTFDRWGESVFDGEDAGMASLIDLAMLSGMYQMFAGFLHGAAMVGTEGMSAADFAARATPFLRAMTESFGEYAAIVDSGDYAGAGQQSLTFSDLTDLIRASDDQGVHSGTIAAVQSLITRQINEGHGAEGFARIYRSFRQ